MNYSFVAWLCFDLVTEILLEYSYYGFKVTRLTPLNSSRYVHSLGKDVFVSYGVVALNILVTRTGTAIGVGVRDLSPNVIVKGLALCRVHRGHTFKLGRGYFLPRHSQFIIY
jgi:hypothetical protein